MKVILLLTFFGFSLPVVAQESKKGLGTIRGNVLTADGQPAPAVSVMIEGSKVGTITNDNGDFDLRKIEAGTHVVKISLLGYIDTSTTVQVLQNETVAIKVQLKRSYAELRAVIVEARAHGYVETKASESLRLNLPLREIPQNIVVTTHQLLADQGLLTMAEAMRTVGGVQRSGGGLNDISLMMRGTDRKGTC
jgi:iron complex outermembrane receptor protein